MRERHDLHGQAGLVQALRSGEETCIRYEHKDADLRLLVWSDVTVASDFDLHVQWTKAHTKEKENKVLPTEQSQSAPGNDMADDLARRKRVLREIMPRSRKS